MIGQRLEVRQGQGLVITPQLQQAIKLLQLSNLELEDFVEAELERDPPKGLADIGAVATACALGYLDFRFAQEPWRDAHPRLAAWHAEVAAAPAIARTAPPQG